MTDAPSMPPCRPQQGEMNAGFPSSNAELSGHVGESDRSARRRGSGPLVALSDGRCHVGKFRVGGQVVRSKADVVKKRNLEKWRRGPHRRAPAKQRRTTPNRCVYSCECSAAGGTVAERSQWKYSVMHNRARRGQSTSGSSGAKRSNRVSRRAEFLEPVSNPGMLRSP